MNVCDKPSIEFGYNILVDPYNEILQIIEFGLIKLKNGNIGF